MRRAVRIRQRRTNVCQGPNSVVLTITVEMKAMVSEEEKP